eukprot:124892-Prymnesium_polylepis.1
MVAAANGHCETCMKLLMDSRSRMAVEAPAMERDTTKQRTLLHFAAMYGSLELARWAINQGASVEVMDLYSTQPFMLAVQYGHCAVIKELIDHGVSTTLGPFKFSEKLINLVGAVIRDEVLPGIKFAPSCRPDSSCQAKRLAVTDMDLAAGILRCNVAVAVLKLRVKDRSSRLETADVRTLARGLQ